MFMVIFLRNRYEMSILGKSVKWRGESHLMALIARWQKGFRNDPFRKICAIVPVEAVSCFCARGKNEPLPKGKRLDQYWNRNWELLPAAAP